MIRIGLVSVVAAASTFVELIFIPRSRARGFDDVGKRSRRRRKALRPGFRPPQPAIDRVTVSQTAYTFPDHGLGKADTSSGQDQAGNGMLLVTGGAGFIGSNVVAALNDAGRADVAVCDTLGHEGKWRNLAKRPLAASVPP